MRETVLVNASTLVVGGGVQVGVSFIEHAGRGSHNKLDFVFAVSRAIHANLPADLRGDRRVHVIDKSPAHPFGGRAARSRLKQLEEAIRPAVVYSIGFPSYVRFSAPEIGRYTNPWEILPNRVALSTVPLAERAALFLKTRYRLRWARHARWFETQTEAAKAGIARMLSVERRLIHVVPNSPNPRFIGRSSLPPGQKSGDFRILCLSAAYRHKNLRIIPEVARQLANESDRQDYVFVLTLPADGRIYREIAKLADKLGVTNMIQNVGALDLDACVREYERADAVFLPTLLEIFSATYVEAMAMCRPIVTSDLDFARDTCGDAALYYNPTSPEAAASAIRAVVTDRALRSELTARGTARLARFPGPDVKHEMLLDWLARVVAETRESGSAD